MTAQKKVKPKAVAKATESVETPVAVGQEQVTAAVKADTEVFKNYEEVIALNRDNVETVVKVNTLFVNGVQDFNKEIFQSQKVFIRMKYRCRFTLIYPWMMFLLWSIIYWKSYPYECSCDTSPWRE